MTFRAWKVIATLALPGVFALAVAAQTASTPELRAELLRMREADQAEREDFSGRLNRNDIGYLSALTAADRVRSDRLKTIVSAGGWPTSSAVGSDGVEAAWLILQHTPDYEWQNEMLPVIERAAVAGDIPRGDVAMLTDKILRRAGRPQRYGSAFSIVAGRVVADPIEDEANLDARRAEVGLPLMSEYVKLLAEITGLPVEWPRRPPP